ncbi:hypothetical protein B0A55_09537 [Friedmanniomyces simplex]|uniref:BCD1 alpha/beta domain-containing protein n=1 Tax=Friedmanniomyces simplex TaxID=329884 RepID=A0A4U0WUB4_9PEZI|nr:hypothetical protein B0A55_09537 [Friedmanniomyces simplex]
MSQQGLLSDLCTVCGKRDPAAYLKKSKLATPSGLDQDFNYLKGIERRIDHASETLLKPAEEGAHQSFRTVATGWRPDSRLQRYLAENCITLERAPKGLQRQRENRTRSTKSNRVLWTVEWRLEGGACAVQHDCTESSTLGDLFARSSIGKKGSRSSRADEGNERQSKRRRRLEKAAAISEVVSADTVTGLNVDRPAPEMDVRAKDTKVESDGIEVGQADSFEHSASGASDPARSRLEEAQLKRSYPVIDSGAADREAQPDTTQPPRHFYLFRPATASASKVLIPLDGKATLTECLANRTIQEYPTVFVLSNGPEALPAGFMLHDDYVRIMKGEDAELARLQRSTAGQRGGPEGASEGPNMEADAGPLDAQGILNMLKRDVRA